MYKADRRSCLSFCWSSVGKGYYREEVTSRPSPKGLAEFHSVQLEDRVVKAGGVTTSGVSCMISDNSTKPSHPGAQDEWR